MTAKLVFIVTALFIGLMAGLFNAYSCSVNPGLARLTDMEYLRAMQSINRAILNPWFFSCFFGALIAPGISAALLYDKGNPIAFWMMILAFAIYAIGVFGITGFGNVPLNEALDKVDLTSLTNAALEKQRLQFEGPWNRFHLIRTIASVLSFIAFLLGMSNIYGKG